MWFKRKHKHKHKHKTYNYKGIEFDICLKCNHTTCSDINNELLEDTVNGAKWKTNTIIAIMHSLILGKIITKQLRTKL